MLNYRCDRRNMHICLSFPNRTRNCRSSWTRIGGADVASESSSTTSTLRRPSSRRSRRVRRLGRRWHHQNPTHPMSHAETSPLPNWPLVLPWGQRWPVQLWRHRVRAMEWPLPLTPAWWPPFGFQRRRPTNGQGSNACTISRRRSKRSTPSRPGNQTPGRWWVDPVPVWVWTYSDVYKYIIENIYNMHFSDTFIVNRITYVYVLY